jgi:hypothetical protein
VLLEVGGSLLSIPLELHPRMLRPTIAVPGPLVGRTDSVVSVGARARVSTSAVAACACGNDVLD